jgi:hypothetical protein
VFSTFSLSVSVLVKTSWAKRNLQISHSSLLGRKKLQLVKTSWAKRNLQISHSSLLGRKKPQRSRGSPAYIPQLQDAQLLNSQARYYNLACTIPSLQWVQCLVSEATARRTLDSPLNTKCPFRTSLWTGQRNTIFSHQSKSSPHRHKTSNQLLEGCYTCARRNFWPQTALFELEYCIATRACNLHRVKSKSIWYLENWTNHTIAVINTWEKLCNSISREKTWSSWNKNCPWTTKFTTAAQVVHYKVFKIPTRK